MSKTIVSTPKKDGFRMPGEYEKHKGTWMLWPTRTDTWRAGAKPAQKAFTNVAAAIAQFEPVTVGVNADQFENAKAMLPEEVRVLEISSNDAWMRDIGTVFVVNDEGDIRGVDWTFNAWGGLEEGLYFPWDQDTFVKQKMLEIEQIDRYNASDIVMEGGAIAVDGEGTLITTEQCVLNKNRNPHLTKRGMEEKFSDYLNIQKVIWLEYGLVNDETDGHVDEVLFFIRPGEVAIGWTDNPHHMQYAVLHEVYEKLKNETDAQGRPLTIHKIPLPEQIQLTEAESSEIDFSPEAFERTADDTFIATYINCYLCNGAVILPAFHDPQDDIAKQQFQEIYPDREIIQVYTREVSVGGGNIHCITQQQPKP